MQNENTQFEKDEEKTGSDIPGGDGTVSDEDVNAISDNSGSPPAKGGQDHSTENYGESIPNTGLPDNNEVGTDIADISE